MFSKKNQFSVNNYIFFAGFICLALFIFTLIFEKFISNIFFQLPFFGYSISAILAFGLGYFFYTTFIYTKAIPSKEHTADNLYLKRSGIERLYSILKILIVVICIVGVLQLSYKIIDIFYKANMSPDQSPDINNPILLYPFYCILIAFLSLGILFLLSSKLKDLITHKLRLDQSQQLNNNTLNLTRPSLYNHGDIMSKHNSDNINESTAQIPETDDAYTLPAYDQGFFYKKLFEINDNVLGLKQNIIIPTNDNYTDSVISELWDDKIEPFLNNISSRLMHIENALNISPEHISNQSNIIDAPKTQEDTPDDLTINLLDPALTNTSSPDDKKEVILDDETIMIEDKIILSDHIIKNDMSEEFTIEENSAVHKDDILELNDQITTAQDIPENNVAESFKDKSSSLLDTINDDAPINLTNDDAPIKLSNNIIAQNTSNDDDEDEFLIEDVHFVDKKETINNRASFDTEESDTKSFNELKEFLELKMQQLYDNEFNKTKQRNKTTSE